jgi:CRP-like cAMP-binding protein
MVMTQRLRKRRDALAHVPLFAECTGRELRQVEGLTTEHRVPAGHVLTIAGELGHECFVIMAGTASVFRDGLQLAVLGPGEVVGEMALLDRGKRTATVIAESDMVLLVMNRAEFSSFQTQVPSAARKMLRTLATRLRQADDGWAASVATHRLLRLPT